MEVNDPRLAPRNNLVQSPIHGCATTRRRAVGYVLFVGFFGAQRARTWYGIGLCSWTHGYAIRLSGRFFDVLVI
jgi:hypothetical protein